ncbi:hypothetical protein LCGC14_0438880 [marine sediment metagenome]|uniref:Uncharacterized protein n=1 Tax=marine sediment metagenome TaxID=412755 RepID=A0A0F9SKT8_9ZZZZ
MVKKIILKAFVNKRTKQLSVAIPKRKLSKKDTTLKEGEDLFVELSIFKKGGKKK